MDLRGGRAGPTPDHRRGTAYIYGEESLYAVEIGNGTERWSVEIGGAHLRCPAVVDGLVYATSEDGLFVLDTETSEHRSAHEGAFGVSPIVVDDTVYAATRAGEVFAFDASSGDTLWQPPGVAEMKVLSTPAYSNGTVSIATESTYADTTRGLGRAIDTEDGTTRWEFETGGTSFSAPAVHEATLIVPDNTGTVYAVDTTEGTNDWSRPAGSEFTCPPAIGDETVYVADQDGTLYALNVAEGDERWRADGHGFVNTGAALAENTVFIAGSNGLFSIDAESGNENWQLETELTQKAPVIADGTIFTAGGISFNETPSDGYAGRLYAFNV